MLSPDVSLSLPCWLSQFSYSIFIYSVFIVLVIYNCLFLLEKPEKGGSSTRRHDEGLLYDNAALETTDTAPTGGQLLFLTTYMYV